MIYYISKFFVGLYIRLFFRVKVIGKKNMPKGNFIGVCNHYSNFDVMIINVKVKKFHYLAKKEMFKNKFVGWYLKRIGGYPVDRQKTDIDAIKHSIKTINSGKYFMVFPEGTRNKTADIEHMQEMKQGAIMLASKTGKPIVPMLIEKPPKMFRRNRLIIGEPMEIIGENPKKLTKEEMDKNAEILQKRLEDLRILLKVTEKR